MVGSHIENLTKPQTIEIRGMGVYAEMSACSGQYSTRCVAARTHVFYLLIFVLCLVSLGCVGWK